MQRMVFQKGNVGCASWLQQLQDRLGVLPQSPCGAADSKLLPYHLKPWAPVLVPATHQSTGCNP